MILIITLYHSFHISRIIKRVQKLLMLIPTDPAVVESLDALASKVSFVVLLFKEWCAANLSKGSYDIIAHS